METQKSQPQIRLEIHEITMLKGTLTSSSNLVILILTRIHAGYFRISLSLGWQALLWKILLHPSQSSPITFQVPKLYYSTILTIIWAFSLFTLVLLSLLYGLRCILRFNLVQAEFMHHVGVNYFFAPWISWILILESAPFVTPKHVYFVVLWWFFVVPIVILDLKIYGQWFTKGKNILTAVANPTSQLSVIGNLVGARAAAKMGWREVSTFLFSLGTVHYLVLFVTLYQRLSGGDRLPAMLRPVFFLFFAAPSVASLAWYSIAGRFDTPAKMLFFLALFLFASLICRPALFKKAMRRFNIAWWAYSYPITILALTAARYEQEVKTGVSHAIRLALSILSVLVLFGLLTFTAVNPKLLLPAEDDPLIVNTLPNLQSEELN
ncbi:S-type anion channel SLAH4-like [Primulina tabacum]|uniref:S-type anion channel SLAH4-like n=1 Tax=Primulina tabacum TaxID=48773 RepID=UPI003F59DBBC